MKTVDNRALTEKEIKIWKGWPDLRNIFPDVDKGNDISIKGYIGWLEHCYPMEQKNRDKVLPEATTIVAPPPVIPAPAPAPAPTVTVTAPPPQDLAPAKLEGDAEAMLKAMSKPELIEYAKGRGIKASKKWNVQTIINKILGKSE